MKKKRKLNLGKVTISSINNSHKIIGGTGQGAEDNIGTNTCGCPPPPTQAHTCAITCTAPPPGTQTQTCANTCDYTCTDLTVDGSTGDVSNACTPSAGCIG